MATETLLGVPQLLTLKEFCGVTRLSPATIHRLIKAGKLPCYQPGGKGGKLLFAMNAIDLVASPVSASSALSADRNAGSQRLSGPTPKWQVTRHRSK
jgi:excisionase family DNA binding protein